MERATYTGALTYERQFNDLMVGIGDHMENDLVRLLAEVPQRTFDRPAIMHWRVDMQARNLPLSVNEGRRHTAPAAHPAQRPCRLRMLR